MVLSDVTQFIRNGANIKQEKGSGGIPITRIETISNSVFNYDRLGFANISDDKYSDYYLQDNDVLLSHINSEKYLGRTVIYKKISEEPIIHGMNLLCLRFNCDEYNPEYFCYYSKTQTAKTYIANNTKKSVNQASITATAIKNMPIPNVNLQTQNFIVKNLNKLQLCIELRNKQLQKLDELIKSRFVEMFGDPNDNSNTYGNHVLSDVCSSIVRGPFGSALKKEFFVPKGIDTYKVFEQKHAIQKDSTIGTYYVSKEKYLELKRFECHSGDILMSCSGTMGELYQLPVDCEKGIINQALCKFTLNKKILPIVFLKFMKSTINNLESKGSGIKNIAAVSYVKAMPMIIPPIELQNQFADFVTKVEQQKATVQKSIDCLETLKKSLMQEYFG